MRLNLTLRQFCIAQFTIVTVVIALGAVGYTIGTLTGHFNLLGFLRVIDVNMEQSLPTYFSTINLLLASILLLVIYYHEKTRAQNKHRDWGFLSILFLWLSIDESVGIHELINEVHVYLMDNGLVQRTIDTDTSAWLPFGVLFVLIVSIVLLRFIRDLPAATRAYFLVAGCVFLAGALGLEYLGVVMHRTGGIDSSVDTANLIRRLVEEGCEMYGIAIFNCALYREILLRNMSLTITGTNASSR